MPHNMRHNRHKRPIARRQGRTLQAATGVGHRDLIVQAKKWMLFESVAFTNSQPAFTFGLENVNVSTTSSGLAFPTYTRLMDQAALSYEEYRVRRVTVRAQPGSRMTNDDRIKTSVFARVDVNSQPTQVTVDNLNSIICSESTVNKSFTERSNIKLVDFKPICFSTGGTMSSSRPILPSQVQWYNIAERGFHLWRGATIAPLFPEQITAGTKAITVWIDVEMEFRSRRPDFTNFITREISSAAVQSDGGETLTPEDEGDVPDSPTDRERKDVA